MRCSSATRSYIANTFSGKNGELCDFFTYIHFYTFALFKVVNIQINIKAIALLLLFSFDAIF